MFLLLHKHRKGLCVEYIQLKRHYIISHEIRKKLGIDEHETNIGLYIRRQLKILEN